MRLQEERERLERDKKDKANKKINDKNEQVITIIPTVTYGNLYPNNYIFKQRIIDISVYT